MRSIDDVATFIGIDGHCEQSSIHGLSREGRDVVVKTVLTEREALRNVLASVEQPAWAIVEAMPLAPFIRESLNGVVERVIICETRENRWIAKSEDKGDPADAYRLARLLRMGEYKGVHIPCGAQRDLRELVTLARKAVGDVTRAKNRIKAKYRQHAINAKGTSVYTAQGRASWLKAVKRPAVRFMLEVLYQSLDSAEARLGRIMKAVQQRMRGRPSYKRLLTIPGFGPVITSNFIAVIDDPQRFPDKRKLWKYAGLRVRRRWSSKPSRAREGGSRTGNRLLKYLAMTAAQNAIKRDNPFRIHYQARCSAGLDPGMAKRTIARKLLATALAMWKNGTSYREDP